MKFIDGLLQQTQTELRHTIKQFTLLHDYTTLGKCTKGAIKSRYCYAQIWQPAPHAGLDVFFFAVIRQRFVYIARVYFRFVPDNPSKQ